MLSPNPKVRHSLRAALVVAAIAGSSACTPSEPGAGTREAVEACADSAAEEPELVDVFSDDAGSLWVALGRTTDTDSFGTSGTRVYFGDVLAASSADLDFCVTERSEITYTVTHHNFQDEAEATSGDTSLRIAFDLADYDDLTPELHVFVDGDATATLAPVE